MSESICVIIPTYNNAGTLRQVLDEVLKYSGDVIVVNDGSTDGTAKILEKYTGRIDTVIFPKNRGKGAALKAGFDLAAGQGYSSAITIDADGQHLPSDIPAFLEAARQNHSAMIVGIREDLAAENKSGGSTFANRFSNYWFTLQTWVRLKDTQCGYRLYPLGKVHTIKFLTSRYEAELELLVFLAWRGARFVQLPVTVLYPEDRVSHFRPFADFARISILNTVLCILALIYGLPRRALTKGWRLISRKPNS
ncbi:MAG: glycosyltransferase family 2 protein [Bacteroidales bacterium]|nr:glycosyltransferase family 2 protein [Bacteroidales bacterium]